VHALRPDSPPAQARHVRALVVGTDSCEVRHVGVVLSGRLAVRHEDGSEAEVGAGQAYVIEPGHDAWVVGDERFVALEFESRSAEEYARS
jgi:hypothetical protein